MVKYAGYRSSNKVPLSKTAKVVYKTTVLTNVLARLIGQFSGTDQPYNPGDMFIRKARWGGPGQLSEHRPVELVRIIPGRGLMRWIEGTQFNVFEVMSVLPCTMWVRKLREIHVYENWFPFGHLTMKTSLSIFTVQDRDKPVMKVRIRIADADHLCEFNKINTQKAISISSVDRVKYDVELEKIVVDN